jgi:hypothetical protein
MFLPLHIHTVFYYMVLHTLVFVIISVHAHLFVHSDTRLVHINILKWTTDVMRGSYFTQYCSLRDMLFSVGYTGLNSSCIYLFNRKYIALTTLVHVCAKVFVTDIYYFIRLIMLLNLDGYYYIT